jgi:hypothetical protein
MHLIQIPTEAIAEIWPLAARMLAPALSYANGATDLAAELTALNARKKQLWMVVLEEPQGRAKGVAAGITSLQTNADGSLTANIEYFGGENMKAWFSLKGEFEQWARDEGCRDVRLWARKGWARHLPEYRITHYIMRKEL